MAKKIYEGMSFDALCKKYLKEGTDIAELASDETTAPAEYDVDEFDAEMEAPVDEFDTEESLESEGDVTITLSADLISALRSILALVDSTDAPVEDEIVAEDDELGAEDDVDIATDEIDEEEEEEDDFLGPAFRDAAPKSTPAKPTKKSSSRDEDFLGPAFREDEEEGIFEEDEETPSESKGAEYANIVSPSSAPNRKRETPAVNRKGAGEGDFSKVSSRSAEGATISSETSAPNRKKGTPAPDRQGTVTSHKAKVGKKLLDINR